MFEKIKNFLKKYKFKILQFLSLFLILSMDIGFFSKVIYIIMITIILTFIELKNDDSKDDF